MDAAPHQQANLGSHNAPAEWEEKFKDGVFAVFRKWTVVQLIVDQEWCGRHSRSRVNQLLDELFAVLLDRRRPPLTLKKPDDSDVDKLAEFLRVKMYAFCDTELEDDSIFFTWLCSNSKCFRGRRFMFKAGACAASAWSSVHEDVFTDYWVWDSTQQRQTSGSYDIEMELRNTKSLSFTQHTPTGDLVIATKCIQLLDTCRAKDYSLADREIALQAQAVPQVNACKFQDGTM